MLNAYDCLRGLVPLTHVLHVANSARITAVGRRRKKEAEAL